MRPTDEFILRNALHDLMLAESSVDDTVEFIGEMLRTSFSSGVQRGKEIAADTLRDVILGVERE